MGPKQFKQTEATVSSFSSRCIAIKDFVGYFVGYIAHTYTSLCFCISHNHTQRHRK
jgi:hypothetical protein